MQRNQSQNKSPTTIENMQRVQSYWQMRKPKELAAFRLAIIKNKNIKTKQYYWLEYEKRSMSHVAGRQMNFIAFQKTPWQYQLKFKNYIYFKSALHFRNLSHENKSTTKQTEISMLTLPLFLFGKTEEQSKH